MPRRLFQTRRFSDWSPLKVFSCRFLNFVSCLFSPHKLNHFLRRISLTYQYESLAKLPLFLPISPQGHYPNPFYFSHPPFLVIVSPPFFQSLLPAWQYLLFTCLQMHERDSFICNHVNNRYCHAGRGGKKKVGDTTTGFLFCHRRLFLRSWLTASHEMVQSCFNMNDCRSFRNTSGPVPNSQTTSYEGNSLTSALFLTCFHSPLYYH